MKRKYAVVGDKLLINCEKDEKIILPVFYHLKKQSKEVYLVFERTCQNNCVRKV